MKKVDLSSLSAGNIFVSHIIAGGILGYALDKYFETLPILLIFFLFLGFIGGFVKLYKIFAKEEAETSIARIKKDDANPKDDTNP